MKKQTFKITGMSCAACQANITKAVSKLEKVEDVNVNLLNEQMTLVYDENTINEDVIINTVTALGYGACVFKNETNSQKSTVRAEWEKRRKAETEKQNSMKKRLVSSVLILIPLMYVSSATMHGFLLPSFLSGSENVLVSALFRLFLTFAVVLINKKFFVSGFKALKSKAPNMDTLVALGSSASFVYGVFVIFIMAYYSGHGEFQKLSDYSGQLYFESSAMILTLVTVGKYLETRSKAKTGDALGKLVDLSPKVANILKDGAEITVNAEDVKKGDTVIIRPGEKIPVDGIIIKGFCTVDQAAVTGESVPVEKTVGDELICATLNKNGTVYLEASKVGNDTTLAQIIKSVDEAGASKAPVARIADKVSGIFVPTVTAIAAVTFIVWLIAGAKPDFALSCAVTVLVISCPCALGLATPVAIMAGTGKAAEYGILIKSASSLEMLKSVDFVVLDKTGTVTKGKPSVSDIVVFDKTLTENDFLRYAASVESESSHPLAFAVNECAKSRGLQLFDVSGFVNDSGLGVNACVNGAKFFAGNERYMKENGIDISSVLPAVNSMCENGKTVLIFANEKTVKGIIAVTDKPKKTSAQAIKELKKLGKKIIMLTGDNEKAAKSIAEITGIDEVTANVLPDEKGKIIKSLQKGGKKVAMVGDGINDAPALMTADVGIAIGAGTDIAIDCADVVLMKNDLYDVVTAFKLSNSVMKNIKMNLFWAFFYNVLGIPVAAGVLFPLFSVKLTPVIGSAAMSLSSVCVVTNALRLRFFKMKKPVAEVNENCDSLKCENAEKSVLKGYENMKITLKVEGMMCAHCKANVENVLLKIDGVESAVANVENKTAEVTLSKEVERSVLAEAIIKAGYKAE